ncbi:MAG: LuxR C-terminal-related transcriptional regulator [Alphaproteobacteria bacterium]
MKQKNHDLRADFEYLNSFPGLVLVKNLKSEFCAMSNDFAHLLGFQKANNYEGKSEYDVPCETYEMAQTFIQNDQHVITTKKESVCVIVGNFSSGRNVLISKTKPLYDDSNNVIGVFAHTKDVTNSGIFNRYMNLIVDDYKITGKSNSQTIYTLNQHQLPCSLSSRQEECLFLIARGKSIKEISCIMNISARTIEDHIAALKVKLDCNTKSQMIEKAINHDFMSFMHESLLALENNTAALKVKLDNNINSQMIVNAINHDCMSIMHESFSRTLN